MIIRLTFIICRDRDYQKGIIIVMQKKSNGCWSFQRHKVEQTAEPVSIYGTTI